VPYPPGAIALTAQLLSAGQPATERPLLSSQAGWSARSPQRKITMTEAERKRSTNSLIHSQSCPFVHLW
jgi:hypothetical protein